MFLYLVTCVYKPEFGKEIYPIYVVATSPSEAEQSALSTMQVLKYKYDDYVEKIECLASVNTYRAGALLVLPS